ncbi:hypothetical protein JAO73_22645 [Hymenobacter sp. BT523]|uniref:hypothetical protein n=1 Tax=Hymenobacter sp. BT523 TaxID=2795725 RepID=UPI0018EE3543|nr:hypothetical protein [Hymenobacter sp. BT523]MBJ6111837.1 hypothetical protein [Hymenobacter sp. BT523]
MGSFRLCFLALLLCVADTGCEWSDETASFRTEPLEPYRRQIEQGRPQPWTSTPRRIVEHLLGTPEREAGPVTYQEVHHLNGVVTLIATEEDVLDDEVYAERRVFTFVSNHGQWALQQVKVGYKCQKSDRRYSGQGCNR